MRVVILGKTRMGTGVCVGGLLLPSHRSVRLIPEGGYNNPHDVDYEVGQIWEIEFHEADNLEPPHTEDIIVTNRTYVGMQPNLRIFLMGRVNPYAGPPDGLYNHLIRFTGNGSGYISEFAGVPAFSTCFWLPDRNLQRQDGYFYYTYPDNRNVRFKFVGFQNPVNFIAAGTLVRMSLARWWAPDNDPDFEERCYVQLSGWF